MAAARLISIGIQKKIFTAEVKAIDHFKMKSQRPCWSTKQCNAGYVDVVFGHSPVGIELYLVLKPFSSSKKLA